MPTWEEVGAGPPAKEGPEPLPAPDGTTGALPVWLAMEAAASTLHEFWAGAWERAGRHACNALKRLTNLDCGGSEVQVYAFDPMGDRLTRRNTDDRDGYGGRHGGSDLSLHSRRAMRCRLLAWGIA